MQVLTKERTIIDIFHDTACPWCWIGITNLFKALQQLQDKIVELRWHPFLLDDSIPAEGTEFRAFMQARKGINLEKLNLLFNYACQQGKTAGIDINFDKISLAVNTKLSHRLIDVTPDEKKSAVVESIYQAYFQNGLNIGDINVLVSLGEGVGMNSQELRQKLSDDAIFEKVTAEAILARQQGINSIPFFIINDVICVDGSHSVKIFVQALNRASLLSRLNPPYWS